eukprot:Em0009g815a
MSLHRVRSHSADTKKAREPRRLTEKIAIMKRKEHEQSEAFEKAMKSIMEMQMARVHGGGGSMPSLQAIDSSAEYPASTIDLQSIYRDFDEVQRTSVCSDRTARLSDQDISNGIQAIGLGIVSLLNEKSGVNVGQFHNQDFPPESSHGASGGSLPDLTNVEFSCGLDVPLEQDDEQLPVSKVPFQSPSRTSGPSKLMYSLSPRASSPTMLYSPIDQRCLPNHGQNPRATPSPFNNCSMVPSPASLDGMQKSSTMPDFSSARLQHASSSTFPMQQYRPFPPHVGGGFPHTESLPNFTRSLSSETHPVTIIIDSPFVDSDVARGLGAEHQQASLRRTPSAATPDVSIGANGGACIGAVASAGMMGGGGGIGGGGGVNGGIGVGNGGSGFGVGHGGVSGVNGGSRLPFSLSSDTQHHSPFFVGHPSNTLPVLPSYLEARQQHALQQRFASISMTKSDMIRSYSEENLQKAPKEKGELIQQNPFMGNLANANSVPCVYVESPNNDIQRYKNESPVPVDSPSTTASYASSPPSVRPYWIDHSGNMNVFVFNEWPADVAGDKGKGGSPLSHHRSLTDLSTIPEAGEAAVSSRKISLLHQLSLPSIALSDLAMDEQMDKQSCMLPLTPPDFEMEEEVVDSLLKEQLPAFDVSSFLAAQRP